MENYHNKDKVFNFYLKIIDLVNNDEQDHALALLNDYRLAYPEIIGMGVDNNSIVDQSKNEFYQILKTEYLIDKISIDKSLKKKLLSIIAVYHLQSNFIINTCGLFYSEFVKEYDVLECTPLIDYLSDSPTGLFEYCDLEDEMDLAEMFFHSIINNAYNIANLNQYLTIFPDDFLKERYLGIEVQPGGSNCDICKGKKVTKFEFSKIKDLPTLPLYTGCICWYSLYSKDDI
jgi:hypothetical protein